jgi:hypothetical protein
MDRLYYNIAQLGFAVTYIALQVRPHRALSGSPAPGVVEMGLVQGINRYIILVY